MTFLVQRADAVEWLATLRTGSAHCCIMDPAYESLEKHRAVGTTTRLTKEWFEVFPNARFPELLAQLHRVLADNAHLYILFDQETARVVTPMAEAAGFKWWKWLVWDKQAIGMGYHYRARHELVGFFEKGKRKLNDLGMADVLVHKRVVGSYPTEKPVALLAQLVEQSTARGEWVLDPFCGSGSTGAAALAAGRNFLGCDVSLPAVDLARGRLHRLEHDALNPRQPTLDLK